MSVIRRLISALRRSNAQEVACEKLAHDLGLPIDLVSGIFDRTAADLRELSRTDPEHADARPIIDRAVQELSELNIHPLPFDDAVMERYLRELPDRDYDILRHFRQDKSHSEIAEMVGTDVKSVQRSLMRTYSGLRIAVLENRSK